MGGVSTEGGSSKLDVELNLVPFIDLLSTLTLFLLVTAVWLQVAAIPASVDSKGQSSSATPKPKLGVRLTAGGMQLSWPSSVRGPSSVGRKGSGYDVERLQAVLTPIAKSHPNLMAAVSSEDTVEYGWVVQAIDAAKNAGMKSVALSLE